jgi:hypothetical protein
MTIPIAVVATPPPGQMPPAVEREPVQLRRVASVAEATFRGLV